MNDASKLTLPLRETVLVAVAAVTVAGAVWTAETGLRSSIQAVSDKIESDQKLQEERLSYMRDTITDLKKRQELTEIELRDLKDMVVRIEANGKR